MAISPTQRALAHCKKQGWTAAVVERWNQFANIRQDLFGFVDLVVLKPPPEDRMAMMQFSMMVAPFWEAIKDQVVTIGIVAVQVTSGSNVSARVTKIKAEPRAKLWIRCGGHIEVWGYRKVKVKRGGKAVRWELRVVEIREADFE